jgi:hypothetical protein
MLLTTAILLTQTSYNNLICCVPVVITGDKGCVYIEDVIPCLAEHNDDLEVAPAGAGSRCITSTTGDPRAQLLLLQSNASQIQ